MGQMTVAWPAPAPVNIGSSISAQCRIEPSPFLGLLRMLTSVAGRKVNFAGKILPSFWPAGSAPAATRFLR